MDLNGHVGEGNRFDEEVMGKFGFQNRSAEGPMVVDFWLKKNGNGSVEQISPQMRGA